MSYLELATLQGKKSCGFQCDLYGDSIPALSGTLQTQPVYAMQWRHISVYITVTFTPCQVCGPC
jgi:hypothetical protein